jgi:hypothetical protein
MLSTAAFCLPICVIEDSRGYFEVKERRGSATRGAEAKLLENVCTLGAHKKICLWVLRARDDGHWIDYRRVRIFRRGYNELRRAWMCRRPWRRRCRRRGCSSRRK